VSLGTGSVDALVFVVAMAGGIALHRVLRPQLKPRNEGALDAAPLPPGGAPIDG
jgi:hypothetical protein